MKTIVFAAMVFISGAVIAPETGAAEASKCTKDKDGKCTEDGKKAPEQAEGGGSGGDSGCNGLCGKGNEPLGGLGAPSLWGEPAKGVPTS